MVSLDFWTIAIAAAVLSTLMGALLLLAWFYVRSEACLLYWGATDLLCAVAVLVLAANDGYTNPYVAPLGNGWLLVASALTYCGMLTFDRQQVTPPLVLLVMATPVAYYATCVLLLMEVNHRVVLYTVITGGWLLAAARVLARVPPNAPAFARILVACFLLGICAIQLARLGGSLVGFRPLSGHLTEAQIAWTFGVGLFCTVGLNFGGLFMVLDRLASCDELTDLSNRRSLLLRASGMLRASLRSGRAISVLLVDLDHFKSINDRFGHSAGDNVLRAFAQVARQSVRRGDLLGRYGGEEFCIVLRDAGAETAVVIAERLRRRTAEHLRQVGGLPIGGTVAIGVACLERGQRVEAIDELIDAADHALYAAKDGGRNRVVLAPPKAPVSAPRLPEPVAVSGSA